MGALHPLNASEGGGAGGRDAAAGAGRLGAGNVVYVAVLCTAILVGTTGNLLVLGSLVVEKVSKVVFRLMTRETILTSASKFHFQPNCGIFDVTAENDLASASVTTRKVSPPLFFEIRREK